MNKVNGTAKKIITKVVIILLAVTSIGFSASALFMYTQLDRVKINKISKSDNDLGITPIQIDPEIEMNQVAEATPVKETQPIKDIPPIMVKKPIVEEKKVYGTKITNIALFGIDVGRQKNEAAHSDAIMIISIDEVHKKIKLSSIIRDTYVDIDGHGKGRINAAYMFGGPELAIKTINKNFNMNIRDYYTVNFSGLADIIDGVGGIDINIKKREIDEVNKYMREVAKIKKQRSTPIASAGLQRLNGKQAVAYARIRKVGNGDFDRTERQKSVLTALIVKIQNQGPGKYPYLISKMLPYVETSMSKAEIVKTGTDVFTAGISNIEWCRFPVDGYYKGKLINKAWYLVTDIKSTKKHLHKFIYEDFNPTKK
ncbi:MAG: hypothetical protein K0R09_3130 [Clostridiales bacterium]|nr:hypothetical protein [Clostridiales bacterium]